MKLTCLVQRWPWRGDPVWCALSGSSRLQISRRRSISHQCPTESNQRSLAFGVNECSAGTHITAGEVTTLQHELRDDTVKLGSSVAEALLAGAEGTEVFSGSGNNIVVKDEVDTTGLF